MSNFLLDGYIPILITANLIAIMSHTWNSLEAHYFRHEIYLHYLCVHPKLRLTEKSDFTR